jgi:sulfatase modifying factor 1
MEPTSQSTSTLRDVRLLAPNAYQLYDMLGNASEWTWNVYQANIEGGANPSGLATGLNRVRRGYSFGDTAIRARSAAREAGGSTFSEYGFRPVRSINP